MGTEDPRLAILRGVAAELRGLAEDLRAERARRAAAGSGDTDWLDRVLADLTPVLVGLHEVELAESVVQVLDRHGPGPWSDDDLAALAGIDSTELRQLRDQLSAAGRAWPDGNPPPHRD
ncbi:hypothetical protein J2W56_004255 [Nocardia kruczakiae]|uniref:Uncharacterized protein n=1 Tax=Nocardia kruczakiae TaxID=261477 RepID=A0ABU1XJ06_9NOCA|nr:hypothetical protein [Nocardia kruczakiae]MDR7170504.1 hypothetical protein [Nocardia kruczakiae]